MARGTATEDELDAGIRKVGVLSAVVSPEGPRRDNPFAMPTARSKAPAPEPPAALPAPERTPAPPQVATAPERRPERAPRPPIGEPALESGRYTDRVTVPMTAEMRTRANLLAAELQRKRTEKCVRFTPNSVVRVAIETFLEHFELSPGDHVNSEEELRRLVHERIAASKRTKGNSS